MNAQFLKDLEEAHKGEDIVFNALSNLKLNNIDFINVSEEPKYYYKGDLTYINWENIDEEKFIEVKTDGCICRTHNILCEDKVFFADKNCYAKGNMYCDSDYFFILSKEEKTIYCLDFKILQKIYKNGKYKTIPHYENGKLGQVTYCYLLPLYKAKQAGALLGEIKY